MGGLRKRCGLTLITCYPTHTPNSLSQQTYSDTLPPHPPPVSCPGNPAWLVSIVHPPVFRPSGNVFTHGLYTKGTRAHEHRKLIRERLWEPKGKVSPNLSQRRDVWTPEEVRVHRNKRNTALHQESSCPAHAHRARASCLPNSNPHGRDGLAHSRSLCTARRALRVALVGVASFTIEKKCPNTGVGRLRSNNRANGATDGLRKRCVFTRNTQHPHT